MYYEIVKHIETANKSAEIAVARVEQLAPLPYDLLAEELRRYPNAQVQWVQEEHRNQGAWFYIHPRLENLIHTHLPDRLHKEVM